MPLTVFSPARTDERLVLTTGGQLNTDRYGLSAASAKWWYYGGNPENQVAIFSNHPRWSFMQCDHRVITRADDGHWDIEATYFGVQGAPAAIYALNGTLSSEPIETHPDFKTFAPFSSSTPSTNGALFDATDGSFKGFFKMPWKTSGVATNPEWIGVREYLNPGVTWTETTVRRALPADLPNLGKIDTPSGSCPSFGDSRTWLFSDCSFDQKGLTYSIRKEWRLSGRLGWNTTIYGG